MSWVAAEVPRLREALRARLRTGGLHEEAVASVVSAVSLRCELNVGEVVLTVEWPGAEVVGSSSVPSDRDLRCLWGPLLDDVAGDLLREFSSAEPRDA